VRDGVLLTPPLYTVLDGITRATVCELASDKGIRVHERPITRDDLYIADELFLTGTAAEVTPVREVDRRHIGDGKRGPITKLEWVNPHAWIYLEVTDAEGQTGMWALEGAGVTVLRRDGWGPDSVEAGDEISVQCHQLRSGSRGCLLGFIEMDDGSWKEFD